jgi:hypothetical protein
VIAVLRLEAIGDNYVTMNASVSEVLRNLRRIPAEQRWAALSPNRRPWVARITGKDSRFGLRREFMVGRMDSRDANAVGSRGIFRVYELDEGSMYEVRELTGWTSERRYFVRADLGKAIEIDRGEVERALAAWGAS